jgi:undecaprenyl-diphosphatase
VQRAVLADLSPLHALILGIVEGLTEYLPVSSTGHLILVGHWLGDHGDAVDAFEIVIQLGALCAVLVHFRALLAARIAGLARGDEKAVRLLTALICGFVPVAVLGLLVGKAVKHHLFAPIPVACALAVGGVAMIVVEQLLKKSAAPKQALEDVSAADGVFVGVVQCLSLIPGTSRSMCTILGGRLRGMSTAIAAEFSFLLALPTLGAATIYEGWKDRHALATLGSAPLAIGLVSSFFVAWIVIAAFLRYLARGGLSPFGVYRVLLAAAVLRFWPR